MNAAQTKRQIEQMCRFIEQEATEKVNEITVKTEQERDRLLAILSLQGKSKINEDFERKKKGLNVQKQIMRAKAAQREDGRYKNERNTMVNAMLGDATTQLNALSEKAEYKDLLVKLIAQGLLKLQEKKVKIKCREQDLKIVESIKGQAIKEYQDFMKKECNVTPKCEIEVNPTKFIDGKGPGGVVLFAHQGKIICDNTLETRLATAFYDLKPVIRAVVFPSMWTPPPDFK